jgi:hypothetical protein
MSQQQEQPTTVVEIKKAPKRTTSKHQAAKEPKPAKPQLSDTAKKRLEELTKEIERVEGLKNDRLAIMRQEHERGVPITEIAGPAGYSTARARQLLSK